MSEKSNRSGFGVISKPSGQLGNHLFQKLFLARLARYTGVGEFHRNFKGNQFLTNLDSRGISISNLARKPTILTRALINELGLEELAATIKNTYLSSGVTLIPSGIMDQHFFKLPYIPTNMMFDWKYTPLNSWSEKFAPDKRIALHFRGKDFEEWDKNAVFSSAYYLSSLESVKIDDETQLCLFTDDPNHEIVAELTSKIPNLFVKNDDLITDFYSLSLAKTIISSPSSFCFWATSLSESKHVIHSKKWLDYKCESGDDFWIGLREDKYVGYQINQEI